MKGKYSHILVNHEKDCSQCKNDIKSILKHDAGSGKNTVAKYQWWTYRVVELNMLVTIVRKPLTFPVKGAFLALQCAVISSARKLEIPY